MASLCHDLISVDSWCQSARFVVHRANVSFTGACGDMPGELFFIGEVTLAVEAHFQETLSGFFLYVTEPFRKNVTPFCGFDILVNCRWPAGS